MANDIPVQVVSGHSCWREIGVYGDRSCKRLPEYVHCRNCPVFAAAARESLGRKYAVQPEELTSQWQTRDRRAQTRLSALVFKLGNEWLGIDSHVLVEVAQSKSVRRIAHRVTGMIEGMVNIRGELQLCLSLRELLGIEPAPPLSGERARLIVVREDRQQGQAWVFRANHVRSVMGYSADQMAAPAATLNANLSRHVDGVLMAEGLSISVLKNALLFEALRQAVFE
jgi:chemotaxis-related protein WspD